MILFNKKAILYKYSRNTNNVSSYDADWTMFACAIQPVSTRDWFEQATVMNTKKMYSTKKVEVWDKVVCDWITYIIDSVQYRDWTRDKYYKSFINMSIWN